MGQSSGFPIVGVGASAGGIPALEGFFKSMPDSPGAAFVIVTHLSPDRGSHLHEVIQRFTGMPVLIAADGATVEPDRVYVMPPNLVLTIAGGRLMTKPLGPAERERKPVDVFLGALARDQGELAVGVVLSGGDGDGTLGAKAIKERGGMTFAQTADESGPLNPDMPESAISAGLIDVAVPVDQMGARIEEFARRSASSPAAADDGAEPEGLDLRADRPAIFAILREQTGHDFSGYKPNTFMRRVQRRMQVQQIRAIPEYMALLRQDPTEVRNLFRDLLINVTSFFRDAEAFEALAKQVIPRLFEGRTAADVVRVWVPGCATGEETYSIAMLLVEQLTGLENPPRVQVFATDIDERAMAVARSARYPEALLESVSPARRERFFRKEGESFVLSGEVRELCIFSPHSVFRDPPF